MKSIPKDKLPSALGNILHDSHAEILAIRAFNAYLIQECATIASEPNATSLYVGRRSGLDVLPTEPQLFAIHDDVKIHMYCSDVPCGDASMELIMESQIDATPWPESSTMGSENGHMMGRGHFDQLGIVRRKPGEWRNCNTWMSFIDSVKSARPDAPLCLSKSCTDKLTIRQCTSLLNASSAMLLHPKNAYLHTLVLPISGYRKKSCVRAFDPNGRLIPLSKATTSKWPMAYAFHPFEILSTSKQFQFCRDVVCGPFKPSKKSAIWTPHFQEIVINGILQGRKRGDPAASSRLSRRRMWKAACSVAHQLGLHDVHLKHHPTYGEFKTSGIVADARNDVKASVVQVLGNWLRNDGDDSFGIEDQIIP
jgi:tRNA-specific adenosine deaminase 1